MRPGTTPTFNLNVSGETFDDSTVYVTFMQVTNSGKVLITKSTADDTVAVTVDGEDSVLTVSLTQEETLSFVSGTAEVQIRAINSSGVAIASKVQRFEIGRTLDSKVIEYDEGDGT